VDVTEISSKKRFQCIYNEDTMPGTPRQVNPATHSTGGIFVVIAVEISPQWRHSNRFHRAGEAANW
jgi:uncharacterized membrane protein